MVIEHLFVEVLDNLKLPQHFGNSRAAVYVLLLL
jgi:hypothetical protein